MQTGTTEQKVQHTPGPWFARDYHPHHIEVAHYMEVSCGQKTPVVSWPGFDDSNRSRGEHLANARLIAAAPDLLGACKAALVRIPRGRSHRETEIHDQLAAAIAKATGQEVARA